MTRQDIEALFERRQQAWDRLDADRVALLGRISGADNGGFMGMRATGRSVSVPIVFFYELRDGRIVRERRIYDFTGVLVQVGVIKAKPV